MANGLSNDVCRVDHVVVTDADASAEPRCRNISSGCGAEGELVAAPIIVCQDDADATPGGGRDKGGRGGHMGH